MNVRPIADLAPEERAAIFERDAGIEEARPAVRDIIERVREEGDAALRHFAEKFDDVSVGRLDRGDQAANAYERLDPEIRDAIDTAIENVRKFHERQVREDWRDSFDGRELGRRFRPLDRVGVYVPGGAAAYPSSAIMGIVPATVAGVEHVVAVTPPAEEPSDVTLGAIHAAGADAVYAVGGAQAIAALAYGTESVDRVQKIVGPGNRWVSAAKDEVQGDVAIDFVAGPSEILSVVDETADPEFVASDLVAQAEHDPNAAVAAVTADGDTATAIGSAVEELASDHEREKTIREALDNEASGIFHARSESEVVLFAEEYAAEHLSIIAEDDEELLARINSAGSVFLGPYTPVAAGDYGSGTNHVLPTTGKARSTGGLSVDHFVRSSTVQRLDKDALSALESTIVTLAEAEGLTAHAESVRTRFE